ncbi:MAG: Lrp/AsnC family transcriptional regulator [Cytophagales bacterium]|nr:Lrp/AsnC family transcriptional regulator [Cytophagales bacterium]
MIKLDAVDLKILDLLQRDARSTIKEIAGKLNLSTTPVFERIKRLEKIGVIDRYVAILNPTLLGKKLTAFIHISIKDHTRASVEAFVERVVSFEEVIECHHVSGDSDFLIQVLLEDIEKYNQFVLEKLSVVPNISNLESRFSLSVRKKTHHVYIEF